MSNDSAKLAIGATAPQYPTVRIEDCELVEFDADQPDGEFYLVPVGVDVPVAPSYAAYTNGEMERVNALLFAARSEAASLGMTTIVRAIDGVRGPLAAKMRGDAAGVKEDLNG